MSDRKNIIKTSVLLNVDPKNVIAVINQEMASRKKLKKDRLEVKSKKQLEKEKKAEEKKKKEKVEEKESTAATETSEVVDEHKKIEREEMEKTITKRN